MLAMAPPSCPGEANEFGQEAEAAIDLGNKIHELEVTKAISFNF